MKKLFFVCLLALSLLIYSAPVFAEDGNSESPGVATDGNSESPGLNGNSESPGLDGNSESPGFTVVFVNGVTVVVPNL
jgi:hypothetical protein